MTTGEIVNAIVNGFVALGTLLLAALAIDLAIYGERFRSLLTGPKLRLVLENPKGSLFQCSNGKMSVYYHLKVVNRRPAAIATNCRVLLKYLWRRMPDGKYAQVPLPYPLVLSWPPSEFTPWAMAVGREELVDFGASLEASNSFGPTARVYPNTFDGLVRPGEAMHYGLEIVSDQFVSKKPQVFEVCWNGEWNQNLDEMAHHLQIREVQD